MGRQKKNESEVLGKSVLFRMTAAEYEKMQAIAQSESRSISNMARIVVLSYLGSYESLPAQEDYK